MAALAIPLGPLLRSMPPLQAYGWDIVGSMLGIAGSRSCPPPERRRRLVHGGGGPRALLGVGDRARSASHRAAGSLGARLLVLVFTGVAATRPGRRTTGSTPTPPAAALRQRQRHPPPGPPPGRRTERSFYDQLYQWFPDRTYADVLIVGAGSGTDVAIALRHGAGHVDAVEIDRAIQKLGIRRPPEPALRRPARHPPRERRPGLPPRTTRSTTWSIFALPDSLTLVSTTANIRLESFLFTEQAFETCATT